MKIEAIPVKVPKDVYEKVKTYSTITGIPVTKVIREALADWLSSVGEARIESLAMNSVELVPSNLVYMTHDVQRYDSKDAG